MTARARQAFTGAGGAGAFATGGCVTMMWITIGAAVLFYAYFKVRRRRLARDN
jgi:hypothetical protein